MSSNDFKPAPVVPPGALPTASLLEAFVENGTSPAFFKDREGRYLLVNRRFLELFQVRREDVVGRTDEDIFPAHVAAAFRANDLEVMESGRSIEFDERAPYLDGTHTSIVLKFPWFHEGQLGGVGGIAVDITERLAAEQERTRLEAKMLQAQKLESLTVLAGGVAHDFNNLLAAMLGNAELALLRLGDADPARKFVQQIATSAVRASDLTRQMLAYAGRGTQMLTRVDVSELVSEMSSLLSAVVARKAAIVKDLRDVPTVEADSTQLRQVVMNLLTNAAEAIEGAHGTITLRTGVTEASEEDLRAFRLDDTLPHGRYVFIEVADTGSGMDQATLSRIFDPFFTTKLTGRGLGLAAVLGILRAHRGAIRATSEPGEGTTFRLLLPVPERVTPPGEPPHEDAPVRTRSLSILVVDDDPDVLSTLSTALTLAGHRVSEAVDGVAGIEMVRERRSELSIVLVDMTMPRLGGEAFVRALEELAANLPVVVMTGHDPSGIAAKFEGTAVKAFLRKPFQLDRLLKVLHDAVSGG